MSAAPDNHLAEHPNTRSSWLRLAATVVGAFALATTPADARADVPGPGTATFDFWGASEGVTIVIGQDALWEDRIVACVNGAFQAPTNGTIWNVEVYGTNHDDVITFQNDGGIFCMDYSGNEMREIVPIDDGDLVRIDVRGNGGDDTITGSDAVLDVDPSVGDGRQALDGGSGNDTIYGGDAADLIEGGTGSDWLFGYGGCDEIRGDAAFGVGATDYILVGDSDGDAQCVGANHQIARGEGGDDFIGGSAGEDYLYGGDDDDWLFGYGGSDALAGGGGADRLYGAEGNDCLYGNAYSFYTNATSDDAAGFDDDDWLYGNEGVDIMCDASSSDADHFAGGSDPYNYHHAQHPNDTTDGNSYEFSLVCSQACLLMSW
jgi:Ca2+-binding RTX toxin-like protein